MRSVWRWLLATAGVALLGLLAMSIGPAGVRPPWAIGDPILALRAPRVLLAATVGAALSLSGAAMQAVLRNELADPYILGLSGGASVGAVSSLWLFPHVPPGIAAGFGAAAAAFLVRRLARGPFDASRLLLAGVAVGTMLGSVTGLLLMLAPGDQLLRSGTHWLFGGLGTPQWRSLAAPLLVVSLAGGWLQNRAARLDRLSLGDEVATSLGVAVPSTRRAVLAAAVALTAGAVAAGGLIGFVGLMAPHIARRLGGTLHRTLLPLAAAFGAVLVLGSDTLARTAFAPREVPVGLLTAMLGGPFFLVQMHTKLYPSEAQR